MKLMIGKNFSGPNDFLLAVGVKFASSGRKLFVVVLRLDQFINSLFVTNLCDVVFGCLRKLGYLLMAAVAFLICFFANSRA